MVVSNPVPVNYMLRKLLILMVNTLRLLLKQLLHPIVLKGQVCYFERVDQDNCHYVGA